LNWIFILKTLFAQKLSDMTFTNPTSTVGQHLLNLRLLKVMPRWVNDDVTTMKPGRQTTGNVWYGQMSRPSRSSLHQEKITFGEHSRKPTIRDTWSKQWNTGKVLWWFGQQNHGTVFCWLHSNPSWPNYCQEYVARLGSQVHPMVQALFLNNDAVLQDYNVQIHTAGPVQLWFVEHAGELQHPWLT
jgi:hypothetical protein